MENEKDLPQEDTLEAKAFTGNVTYTINGYTFVEETLTARHGINDTPPPVTSKYPY